MTDLFVGQEPGDFVQINASFLTGSGGFRTGFGRGVFQIGSNTSDPPANRATGARAWTPGSLNWFHWRYGIGAAIPSDSLNATLFRVLDGTTARLVIRSTATAGQLKIDKRNSAGSFTNLVTSAPGAIPPGLSASNPMPFDLYLNYSTTGQATFYFNGSPIMDTGPNIDVTTDGATTVSNFELGGLYGALWSEILVRDSVSTLGAAVVTLPPLAAGNTQSWLPNTVGNINGAQTSDSTNINTTSNNAISEWTVTTTLPTGHWTISSVNQYARVNRGLTGPQNFGWIIRTSDGSDHQTGTITLTTGYNNFALQWPTNPFTGLQWQPGEFINQGIVSLP